MIRVYTKHCVSFSDLPEPIDDIVHDVCCEWDIKSGETIDFEAIFGYYEEQMTDEAEAKMDLLEKFMAENDISSDYYIDCEW